MTLVNESYCSSVMLPATEEKEPLRSCEVGLRIDVQNETASDKSLRVPDDLRTNPLKKRDLDRRICFFAILLVAGLIYSQFQFRRQPSTGDRANWDYFAQVVARGGVPYRDVVNIKTPLSAYLGAAAIVGLRPFGVRDVIAIRVVYLILAALTAAFVFLVALDGFENPRLAVTAAAAMLAFDTFARFNSGGVQPKTPAVLFGLVSLWAALRDRYFAAGVFGMLSALSWQPGLLFAGVAFLSASRYLTSWRDYRALKVALGALLPLTVMLGYFWLEGVLRDFYLWNIHYALTVYAPRELRTLGDFFALLGKMLGKPYRRTSALFYLSIAGLAIAARYLAASRPARPARYAILIAPLIYFAFCVVDIQGPVDLILFVPFVAILSAAAIILGIEKLLEVFGRMPAANWTTALIAVAFLGYSAAGAAAFERPQPLLSNQQQLIDEIVAQLKPGDKVFVHGRTELLVLANLPNASKYFFLDRGKDVYLDQIEPGGFAGWFERLKAERPKVIALDRFEDMEHEADFRVWARADYEPRVNQIFTYFVRKADPPQPQ